MGYEGWNPTTGCGLRRFEGDATGGCYAMAMARRLKAMGQAKYRQDGDPRSSGPGFALRVHPDTLSVPLRWRQPERIFVNSISDLFHARVPIPFLAQVFAVMARTPQHTYQVLTKRPERMRAIVSGESDGGRHLIESASEADALALAQRLAAAERSPRHLDRAAPRRHLLVHHRRRARAGRPLA